MQHISLIGSILFVSSTQIPSFWVLAAWGFLGILAAMLTAPRIALAKFSTFGAIAGGWLFTSALGGGHFLYSIPVAFLAGCIAVWTVRLLTGDFSREQ